MLMLLFVSHIHSDDLDVNTAAAVNKNCLRNAKLLLAQKRFVRFGKAGVFRQKRRLLLNLAMWLLSARQRSKYLKDLIGQRLITEDDPDVKLAGKMPQDMNKIAVNYLFETTGGNLYLCC